MKKIIYSAMILSLMLATSCSKNKDDGTWNTSLGKARFATAQTWVISGNGITQVWSDAVEIIGAEDTYNGGNETDGFRIDFRSNPDYKGNLFSWRAVVETANICPAPWRVPTVDDFINLDKALGGNGENRSNSEFVTFINAKYFGDWGGTFDGYTTTDGTLLRQGLWANYWSVTEGTTSQARSLRFGTTSGFIFPQSFDSKSLGFTLRCVRD